MSIENYMALILLQDLEIHKNDQPDAKQMVKKVGKFNFDYEIFNSAFKHSLKTQEYQENS